MLRRTGPRFLVCIHVLLDILLWRAAYLGGCCVLRYTFLVFRAAFLYLLV